MATGISIGRYRGGFCVYWRDPGTGRRKRHQLKARTRAEAEAEAIDVFRRKSHREGPHTVADIWELYRRDLGDKPTAKTMAYTGKAILPHFGHFRPDQITREHCRGYNEKRQVEGKSQGTVHTELGHLRSALVFAKKTGVIDRAPYIWRPEKPQTDKRILSHEEATALVQGAHDPHIRLALVLLLGTAARVGAVLDLTWERVDFERGIINLRLDDSRTRKGRAVVPMNSMTRAALSEAKPAALTDHVIEYAGHPVKSIRKGFINAIGRSGIGHVRIHDLRHTAAVTMLGAGVPMELVSQILGHSNISVTYSIYGRYQPSHMLAGIEHLNFATARSESS